MQITLGPQYNVGEKPTVILYIYINRLFISSMVGSDFLLNACPKREGARER